MDSNSTAELETNKIIFGNTTMKHAMICYFNEQRGSYEQLEMFITVKG